MQYITLAAQRLIIDNFSFYLLCIIMAEWIISFLVNRGLAKRFGAKVANIYNCELTFSGVIHHELSHAILALLSGAYIQKICLYRFPWTRKKQKDTMDENCLGYVMYNCRGIFPMPQIQNMLTGIAPIILGSVSIFFCGEFLLHLWQQEGLKTLIANPWSYLVLYLMISIAHHACPSGQDMKNARVGLLIVFIIGLLFPMSAETALLVREVALIIFGIIVLPALPFILLTNF